MRKSVRKNDVGFDPNACNNYEVFLNGGRIKDCHTADEEMGEAHVYYNHNDVYYLGMEELPTKVLKGRVEIVKTVKTR